MFVCMFQHNSGTLGAISTKLGTHMAIYIYIYIKHTQIDVCVCGYECSSITLERPYSNFNQTSYNI
jgi:hypothetical protein